MKLNLELFMDVSCTAVRRREQHVKWDLQVGQHIAIGHLNVLNLSGICLAFKGFDTNELDFDRFDLDFRLFKNQIAIERLIEAAID